VETTGVPGTAVPPDREAREFACSGPADLTWLLHRAAQRMRAALDEAARGHGLAGARDWLVLSAVADGPRQTQLALAHTLGLDKTTLTSLLDRLETRGLITRAADSRDRRARIPVLTPSGLQAQRRVALARDEAESAALCGFSAAERDLLRDLLRRLAADPGESGGPGNSTKTSGSCI
jgi:DNA-binding MarR family transcriptional regulator